MLKLIEAAPIRPSSTVVLAREGPEAPEIFVVRRHAKSSFGTAYAFPGGVVDPDDAAIHRYCVGLDSAEANARLGVRSDGLDYYSACIRELFEESGVLLADLASLDESLATIRESLNDGSMGWADFVMRDALQLDCRSLHYIGHWVTPPAEPKRYSTRFFLAALPNGQIARHCGGELTDSHWATATEILSAERRGDMKMIFPTVKTLESIARHKTMEALLDWASSRVEWGITTMIPLTIERNGKREIVLPGDIDYPGSET